MVSLLGDVLFVVALLAALGELGANDEVARAVTAEDCGG